MRVALFTETYLPYINGVVTHVKILKEGLEKLGHEVLVVCADAEAKHHYIKKGILHCPAKVSKKFYNFGLASPVSTKRLKLIKEFNPDIIHIHNEFGVGFSGMMIAKILKKPLVYTLHTMYDDYLYYIASTPFIPFMKKISHGYFKFLGNSASALTGPSKKVDEYFKECGVNKPVNVIPNPVELDIFEPDNISEEKKHEFRKNYNISDDTMLVCFCGRLGKEKSVDVLINFWAQTVRPEDNMKLFIIGDGPAKPELEQLSKELNVENTVTFTGAVMHDELPPYYACCDCYVTTSLSDTNSISMLEAMATGLPVLCLYDELNQGQVINGVNGFVFKDAQEMYEQLINLKNRSELDKKILRHSVRDSVKQSGAENLAKYLIDIYNNQNIIPKKSFKDKLSLYQNDSNRKKIKIKAKRRTQKDDDN